MNISVYVVILTLVSLCRSLFGCPAICTCNITHTNCSSNNNLLLDWLLNQISSNITNLSLSRNNITTINSRSLLNHTRLLQLDLSRNQLLTLHSFAFTQLSNLEVLDLSNNFLENLPMDLFSELSSLRKLALSNNSLKELHPQQFQYLPELQHLDISFNNLISLNPGILCGVQALKWLSLAGNKLSLLERPMLESHTGLQNLLLKGNQWNCSCTLIPFRLWLEWMLYRGGYVDDIKCSSPVALQGQDLRIIPSEMFKHCSELPFVNSRNPPSCTDSAAGLLVSSDTGTSCLDQPTRAMNLRRAPTTIVLARLVCGVVWLMMMVAAMYGCIYAMLAAKHRKRVLKQRLQDTQRPLMEKHPKVEQEEEDERDIKADLNKRAETQELKEWIALPPEVCV